MHSVEDIMCRVRPEVEGNIKHIERPVEICRQMGIMQEITRLIIIYKAEKHNIPTQRQQIPPQKNQNTLPYLKSLHFLHLMEIEYATQVPMSSTLPLNFITLQINWLMMVLVKFPCQPYFGIMNYSTYTVFVIWHSIIQCYS